MIKFTGHQLDAVVCSPSTSDELVAAAAPARPGRGPRRRHRGRHPAPPGGLRRADRAAHRGLPRPRPPRRGRRHGRGRRGHPAHLRRPRRRPGELSRPRPMGWRDRGVEIKTPEQVAAMRRAGLVVGRTLELLRAAVRAGVTTGDSTRIAEDASAPPAPRRRSSATRASRPRSAPRSTTRSCTASPATAARRGRPVSIDCGAIVDGWHGDAAITVPVGEVRPELTDAGRRTEDAMWAGIAAARLGRPGQRHLRTPSRPPLRAARRYGILEDYTGHGIGTAMHQPPDVPNVGRAGPRRPPGAGHGPGRRADGHPRHATRPTSSTTTGPW